MDKEISSKDLRDAIRHPYAWPGGYPRFALCSDGGCLHLSCCRSEYRQIAYSKRHNLSDGWRVVAVDVNWEDADLTCDHCGEPIESAYAEQEEAHV